MNSFTNFLDQKLSGPMAKIANERHLRAIRDGIVATLPLVIVGSFFLVFSNFPLPETYGFKIWLMENAARIVLPYRMTMAIMTLYATFGIGYSLAKSYDVDPLSGGILATTAFLLTFTPVNIAANLDAGLAGWAIGLGNMGGAGMFVGIITSMLAVEIYRLCVQKNLTIKMPEQVPPAVSRSFEALFAAGIVILFFGGITYWAGFDWHSFISNLVKPIISAADSLISVILQVLLTCFFWVFGIHGVSIVGAVARPFWVILRDANITAAAAGVAGTALPQIAAEEFFQWFIWIGGSGATIGLAISMLTAKSAYLKSLGRTSIVPAIFNINEPLVFGTPIVMNPILMIPFILTPIVLATISWIAMSFGLVNRVSATPPWTLPGPIGAFLATGADWRAIVLSILLIIVSVVIYYPFVKMYDKRLLLEEQGETENAVL